MHGEHGRACPSRSVPRLQRLGQHLGAQLCRQPPQPGQTRLNSGRQRLHLPCAAWLRAAGCPMVPPVPPGVPQCPPCCASSSPVAARSWQPAAGQGPALWLLNSSSAEEVAFHFCPLVNLFS